MSEIIRGRLAELEEQSQNLDKAWEAAFAAVGEASRTMRRVDHESMLASLELKKLQDVERQWRKSELALRGLNAELRDLQISREKGEAEDFEQREANLLRWIGAELYKQQELEKQVQPA